MAAWWLALVLGISVWMISVPVSGNMENKLIDDLLNMSTKNARPLKKSSDVLEVKFALSFQSFDIDEQAQTLTAISYETQHWQDQILQWDPQLYSGISQVVLDKKDVWTPDITLFNTAVGVDVHYGQGNVVITSGGDETLTRSSISKVRCDVDSLHFPFDALNCTMTYGSWVYSGEKLDLSLYDETVDLSNYKLNPTWKLIEAKVEKKTEIYACCPEPYYSIVYQTKFHRDSSHYFHVLLVPCFLLSILTILLFLLPTHSSERITLGVLLFCAFFILLLYTSSLVSGWNRLPYFVTFLIFNLVVITLFTFLNSFIVKLSISENGQGVPQLVRKLMFDILARIFCMKSIVQRNQSRHPSQPESGKLTTSEKPLLEPASFDSAYDSTDAGLNGQRRLEADVALILALTTSFGQKMKDADREKKTSKEWKDLAAVVNRLFFVIYETVVTIAIGVVYIQISE